MEAASDCVYGVEEVEEGCRTPRHEGCRIPLAPPVCPPAPRKKGVLYRKKERSLPKEVYFQHPADVELFFKMISVVKKGSLC